MVKLTYATAGGAGAVTITVQWKLPAEADFGHDASVVRPEQTLSNGSWAGATVAFRTKSVNAGGEAALSAVKSRELLGEPWSYPSANSGNHKPIPMRPPDARWQ